MQLASLLDKIQPQWRDQFIRFIDKGEADDAFLAYVDADTSAQEAVELAFNAQSEAFHELSRSLQLQAEAVARAATPNPIRTAPVLRQARAHG